MKLGPLPIRLSLDKRDSANLSIIHPNDALQRLATDAPEL